MKVRVSMPGAYMAVEMESEQAQKTFRKLTEILGFQAKGQEPEKPLVEFPVPELMRFPGMDSAEQEMEEGPEVYTELDGEKESDDPEVPLIEPSTGYGGFLYIKCPDCGEIKGFCAKVRINNFRCGCGSVTRLEHLVPLYMNCECGRKSRYLTNMDEPTFDMTCYDCGSPVAIVWNDKKKQYETMEEEA